MMCERCGGKTEGPHFIFCEVDQRDRKHKFGIFCSHCTIELLDQLKGKLEWFHGEGSWKGYVHPEARRELENTGFIDPKHSSQIIEMKQVGRKRGKIGIADALTISRVRYAGGLISKEEYEKLLEELKRTSP